VALVVVVLVRKRLRNKQELLILAVVVVVAQLAANFRFRRFRNCNCEVCSMSHWAAIDNNNIVTQVLVGPNYGDEGEAFFNALGGTWVKTSYNGNIRKNYAGIGYSYDLT
jgi:hypothetical protein